VRMGVLLGTFSRNLHLFTLFFFPLFISLLEFAPLFVWDSSLLAPESQVFFSNNKLFNYLLKNYIFIYNNFYNVVCVCMCVCIYI
jgi:hypothetical protein